MSDGDGVPPEAGGSPSNPLTLSQEEVMETMRASGGYVCFAYHGMGWTTYLRWHPALQQYEALTTRRRPTLQNGVVVIEASVTDHWAISEATIGDFLPEQPTASTETVLDVIDYETTPFDGAGAPEGEWSPGQATSQGISP